MFFDPYYLNVPPPIQKLPLPPELKVDCLPRKTVLSKVLTNGPEMKILEAPLKSCGKVLTGAEHVEMMAEKQKEKNGGRSKEEGTTREKGMYKLFLVLYYYTLFILTVM